MSTVDFSGYDDATVDKVKRLLELLAEIDRHPYLASRVCLHGGTAINLFLLDAPRLSIDIDLNYYGKIEKEAAAEERPQVEESIKDIASSLGYSVSHGSPEHAGRTFKLHYRGIFGTNMIKIDSIYLNRSPLLAPAKSVCTVEPTFSFTTLSWPELVGGKVKALFERVAMRDIYDVWRLKPFVDAALTTLSVKEKLLIHRIFLYQVALSKRFPVKFEGLTAKRFEGRDSLMKSQLYSVLREDDRPNLDDLIVCAEDFVRDNIIARDEEERAYLSALGNADYRPELLFADWPEVLHAAVNNPAALWKIINLEKSKLYK